MTDHDFALLDVPVAGVGVITLNNPDRLNAWSGRIAERFWARIDEARDRDDIRVVVITGAGRGFCPGADMDALNQIRANPGGGSGAAVGSRRYSELIDYPKPVIAAINGAAAGVGLVLAMFCDIRFAASGAKFTTAFSRRGLIAEYGASWALPRLVGLPRALDLLLSGRVFTSDEAGEMGFVNAVVAPDQLMSHTLAYASDLAQNCSPTSWAVMKKQVYGDHAVSADEATSRSLPLMDASLKRADFQEGVQSYLDKRPPNFAPFSG